MDILDHGYLTLVEAWGSDAQIVEAARMSTGKGFLGWGPQLVDEPCPVCRGEGVTDDRGFALTGQPFFSTQPCVHCGGDKKRRVPGDEKLLKFLWDHAHATPFEMAGLTVEVKAPLMVFREWHRHRVPFGYNEMSARYTPLPDENYVPALARLFPDATTNKQAQAATGAARLTEEAAQLWLDELVSVYADAQRVYEHGIKIGIPKELARLPVPVGRYSRMRATGNLRGWLAFMKLRCAPQAQWEIRQFANAVGDLVKERFPRTFAVAAQSVGLTP